jgi:ABC-2 type transport system ATP-binding protein
MASDAARACDETAAAATAAGGLVLDGLVKRYASFALGPLRTTFEQGRKYGLLGPNGAGKSTLLGCIAGQVRPSEGLIHWHGRPLRWGDWRSRADMAFITEVPSFYDELTVAANLGLAAEIHPNWDEDFALRWSERWRLDLRRRFGELSRGTKLKAALVASLAHRSELVLLDEPTSGLDPDTRDEVQRFLAEAGVDRLVIVSSHLFEDVEAVADEVKILRDGSLVFESSLARVTEMTVVRRSPGPIPGSLAVVGRWRSADQECLLIDAAALRDPDVERLLASARERRPATVRDLYRAFGRDA